MDPDIRKSIKLEIKDAIIVFDEAHNIEGISEESCSVELTYYDLD